MKKHIKVLYVAVCVLCLNAYLPAQQTAEEVVQQKDLVLQRINFHKDSIEVLQQHLSEIEQSLANIQLQNLKDGELKLSVGNKTPFLLDSKCGQCKIPKYEVLTIVEYDVEKEKVKVYSPSLDEVGYVVKLAFEDQALITEYISQRDPNVINQRTYAGSEFDPSINPLALDLRSKDIYATPDDRSSRSIGFDSQNAVVTDYVDSYFKVKDPNGNIGYVFVYGLDKYSGITASISRQIIEERTQEAPIYIKSIKVTDINSADGVDFSIEYAYFNSDRTVKYLEFTVTPFNAVGDPQKDRIGGHTVFTGEITGPITPSTDFHTVTWAEAWYNSTINCVQITKVKVIYMDGSSYTYVNELPKIVDPTIAKCN